MGNTHGDNGKNGTPPIDVVAITPSEIGETTKITIPGAGTVGATWLGVVDGTAWTLTNACGLMINLHNERQAAAATAGAAPGT